MLRLQNRGRVLTTRQLRYGRCLQVVEVQALRRADIELELDVEMDHAVMQQVEELAHGMEGCRAGITVMAPADKQKRQIRLAILVSEIQL